MNFKNVSFSIMLLVIAASCKTKTFGFKAEDLVVFGSEGGITGASERYLIYGNGKMKYVNSLSGDTIDQIQLSKDKLKSIRLRLNEDSLGLVKLNENGNMTNFIEVYDKGTLKYNYRWPNGSESIPGVIRTLNEELYSAIPKH